MSKLTLGKAKEMPAGWSFPSPLYNFKTGKYEHNGIVWVGKARCTMKDVEALKKGMGEGVQIDVASCFGGESHFDANVGRAPYHRVVVLGKG